jgi:hypothetical protein
VSEERSAYVALLEDARGAIAQLQDELTDARYDTDSLSLSMSLSLSAYIYIFICIDCSIRRLVN